MWLLLSLLLFVVYDSQQEQRLDEAIKKLDNMDEDDFEALRQKRLEKLKQQQRQKTEWTFLGHGV